MGWRFLVLFLLCAPLWAEDSAPAERLFQAYMLRQPLPNQITADPDKPLDPRATQQAYTKLRQNVDPVIGYALMLSTPQSQATVGLALKEPLVVALFASELAQGRLLNPSTDRPLLEIRLGFIVKAPITTPIEDARDIPALIGSIAPLVTYSVFNFEDTVLSPSDLIATNAGSHIVWLGATRPVADIDVAHLDVVLRHQGAPLYAAKGKESLGSQWESIRLVINQSLANQWPVDPNHYLITGSLGKSLSYPAVGEYIAEFGSLGSIAFQIGG